MPPTTELQQRQDDNDALSRRIGRTDRAAAFVAVGAGLALLAGGTLALIESRAARLRVDGETVGVAVSF
jgi:hypothetical protein